MSIKHIFYLFVIVIAHAMSLYPVLKKVLFVRAYFNIKCFPVILQRGDIHLLTITFTYARLHKCTRVNNII